MGCPNGLNPGRRKRGCLGNTFVGVSYVFVKIFVWPVCPDHTTKKVCNTEEVLNNQEHKMTVLVDISQLHTWMALELAWIPHVTPRGPLYNKGSAAMDRHMAMEPTDAQILPSEYLVSWSPGVAWRYQLVDGISRISHSSSRQNGHSNSMTFTETWFP